MLYQLSYFRAFLELPVLRCIGAESQIRTGDTAIFSRVLYQLSYLGLPVRSGAYTTSWAVRRDGLDRGSGRSEGLRFLHRGAAPGDARDR